MTKANGLRKMLLDEDDRLQLLILVGRELDTIHPRDLTTEQSKERHDRLHRLKTRLS